MTPEDAPERRSAPPASIGGGALDAEPPRRIGRQLSAAFLIVWIIAAGLSVVHLTLLREVKANLEQMRADEMAIRDSLGLAAAIREQYIHVAHCIVHGNLDHLPHYEHWAAKVSVAASTLRGAVPASERRRVDSIGDASRKVDRIFRGEIVPALGQRDLSAIRAPHARIEEVSMAAAAEADLVASGVEDLMASAHMDAIAAARAAWWSSIAGIALLAAVAAALALSLRGVVLRPLATLTAAAQRLGTGDLDTRVGEVGQGELGLLAHAFDRMAEQLRLHQKQLVANERMAAIGQLAAGVAHEINNPIAVIRGYVATMRKEADDDLAGELAILDEEAVACQRIAEDLLSYAKSGELVVECAPMDEVVRQAADRFGASADAKGRTIATEVEPAERAVDVVRVRQVVQNLLRNAIQATDSSAVVEVTGEALPGGYRITVADRGPGVPDSLRIRAFEPFFSGRRGGSGLGLAVSKGIVEAHDGSIELLDRAGGGTRVVVTLRERPEKAQAKSD